MDTKKLHAIHNMVSRHDERILLPGYAGDALDPFTDEHNIEYWLWDGERLIPASPDESERLREREALLRLGYWQSQSERNGVVQHPQWHGKIRMVHWMHDKLLAYISQSSSRTK